MNARKQEEATEFLGLLLEPLGVTVTVVEC
jgi:hypothetical protein